MWNRWHSAFLCAVEARAFMPSVPQRERCEILGADDSRGMCCQGLGCTVRARRLALLRRAFQRAITVRLRRYVGDHTGSTVVAPSLHCTLLASLSDGHCYSD